MTLRRTFRAAFMWLSLLLPLQGFAAAAPILEARWHLFG
jgi:hypothetical protein